MTAASSPPSTTDAKGKYNNQITMAKKIHIRLIKWL